MGKPDIDDDETTLTLNQPATAANIMAGECQKCGTLVNGLPHECPGCYRTIVGWQTGARVNEGEYPDGFK